MSIAKSTDPVRAARSTPEASIVQAARAVASGRAQALVCAGGTGAAVAAGLFNIKRARGIHRPALALPLPVPAHPVTLLDVGANAEARKEHLVQFAFMGAALAQVVLGVRRPRVGLLSNGEEAERGSALVVAARAELQERVQADGWTRRLWRTSTTSSRPAAWTWCPSVRARTRTPSLTGTLLPSPARRGCCSSAVPRRRRGRSVPKSAATRRPGRSTCG